MPAGAATRTGIWSTLRPSSAAPASWAAPPVRITPAGSIPTPAARISLPSSSKVSRIRASMIWQTSSRLTVRPASSPRTETLISSSSASSTARRSAVPWRIFSSSATWRLVLSPIATSLVTLLPPTGRTRVWKGEPSWKSARSMVPAPMSATATPSSFSVSDRTASADAEQIGDELVDLHAGRGHALGQVLDGRGGRGDDVGLDLEPQRAHPERVLHALLAVDREAPPLDVEDLAVGRDRDRAGDLDGAVDVLAGDLAMVRGDRDLAGRVDALDMLAADADEGAVDLPAGQALGPLDRVGDGADGLVDVDDHALLEAGGGNGAVAHDRQPAVAAHLADERADLARADVDADEDRFPFHHLVRLSRPCCRSRGSVAG